MSTTPSPTTDGPRNGRNPEFWAVLAILVCAFGGYVLSTGVKTVVYGAEAVGAAVPHAFVQQGDWPVRVAERAARLQRNLLERQCRQAQQLTERHQVMLEQLQSRIESRSRQIERRTQERVERRQRALEQRLHETADRLSRIDY